MNTMKPEIIGNCFEVRWSAGTQTFGTLADAEIFMLSPAQRGFDQQLNQYRLVCEPIWWRPLTSESQ